MADDLDMAREVIDLAMAALRRVGAVKRYRVAAGDGSARAVAALRGERNVSRGEVRLEVLPRGEDAEVVVRWTSPLGGRWWAEVVDLPGGLADPYAADWSVLDGVIADVRRWAQGSVRPQVLTTAYSRPPIRRTAEAAFERGMVWA